MFTWGNLLAYRWYAWFDGPEAWSSITAIRMCDCISLCTWSSTPRPGERVMHTCPACGEQCGCMSLPEYGMCTHYCPDTPDAWEDENSLDEEGRDENT